MNKILIGIVIMLMVFLVACGGKQMQAKPIKAPNGAVTTQPAPTAEQPAATPVPTEESKTAAEALKELQGQLASGATQTTGPKQGATGMPPAPVGLSEQEALKARTRALMSQGSGLSQPVDADTQLGARYAKDSDLPKGYGDEGSAGD